jgi:hypothetical protein
MCGGECFSRHHDGEHGREHKLGSLNDLMHKVSFRVGEAEQIFATVVVVCCAWAHFLHRGADFPSIKIGSSNVRTDLTSARSCMFSRPLPVAGIELSSPRMTLM